MLIHHIVAIYGDILHEGITDMNDPEFGISRSSTTRSNLIGWLDSHIYKALSCSDSTPFDITI